MDQKDCERFAFSVPVFNNSQPLSRYQWKVLPQGMLNSPTLCQEFVHRALDPVRKRHPSVLLYHYMDDILLAAPTREKQQDAFVSLQAQLSFYSLNIASEKIQLDFPIQYLGYTLGAQNIRPQRIQIRRDHLKTLNDFQKLLGDINWMRPVLGIPTYQLQHLFSILEGDNHLDSSRHLTPLALQELQLVEEQLQKAHLHYILPDVPLSLCLFHTLHSPTGMIHQTNQPLKWIFLSNKTSKHLATYIDRLAELIIKGRHHCRQLWGGDPSLIISQFTHSQIIYLLATSDSWQEASSILSYSLSLSLGAIGRIVYYSHGLT